MSYRLVVWPWLRLVGSRLIMPNWTAITIRTWIFSWRPLDEAELAHELVHVRQWRENGFLHYIRRYLAASRQAAAAGGNRYRDNRFEVEARKAEQNIRNSANH